MRFCPFCAQENPDDVRECVHCGKRLPALRHGPSRPPSLATRPAPPRPLPPRPAPRAPTTRAPEAFAPTVAPGTLPPVHQPNGPARAKAPDSTLQPVDDNERTRERGAPAMPGSAPTGTLLGIPTQEIPTTVQPAPGRERDGQRTTKPLSIRNVAREAQRAPQFADDEDAATVVQTEPPTPDLDEGPTSRTPLVDDLENAKTTTRPAPRSRPLESLRTTPAGGLATRPNAAPPARKPTPAGGSAPRKPTPAAGVAGRSAAPQPRVAPLMTPEPLPPPPSLVPTKPTALPAVTNEAGSFPQLDLGPTPAIPLPALPPMPAHPTSGSIVEAVKYLVPLGKAIWARKKAQEAIRTLLHGDQRLLDSVLRDLGRVAREERVEPPALAAEMRAVQEQEERRDAAAARVSENEAAQKREADRWHIDQGERLADITRREAELKSVDEELRVKAEQRRLHEAERVKLDAQIRAIEKRAAAADAKAQKAEVTPPEKGGGPNTAANARAQAAEARKEATGLIPARDAARAAAEELDAPIAALTKQITDGRAALQQKRKDLADAKSAHERTLAELAANRDAAAQERDGAERELTQRFVTAGTILNLNRVDHPRLQPLFARIDELKVGVNAREAAIVRLESERRLYDRAAVQKGLLTVGIALGTVIILAIILIVVLSR